LGYPKPSGGPISELDETFMSSALRRVVVEYDLDCDEPAGFVFGFVAEFELFFMTSGAFSFASASRSKICKVELSNFAGAHVL
jgi:hypothetical protein